MDFLNDKFSTRAKNALKNAQNISRELGHRHIGSEHLLCGILFEKSSFASEILANNKLTAEAVRLELVRLQPPATESNWTPKLSDELKAILETSAITASKYKYQFIGTEHFLFGILERLPNTAGQIMVNLKVNTDDVKESLQAVFDNTAKFPDSAREYRETPRGFGDEMMPPMGPGGSSALEYFAVDLSEKAEKGHIDPLIGRGKEAERLISILSRRTKNNPLLIGEPGVGKTAIVEGLALAIRDRRVPDTLYDKKILALDLALIVAGSMFRGEFENRLKQIIDEVKEAGNIILFIDELHTVVGAGATTGSLDAANILKPALARGELRAIGATTLSEYKKYIEPDAALERRFQPIEVREPSPAEALDILGGLREYYENFHGMKITNDALEKAVTLSQRYLTDRFLPDKALDLIDETASFAKLTHQQKMKKTSLKSIELDLDEVMEKKKQAVFRGNFAAASALKSRQSQLLARKQVLEKKKRDRNSFETAITGLDIARTVTRVTGIPIRDIAAREKDKLLRLESILKKQIIGQDHVLEKIASAIRRSRSGIGPGSRPMGSFMFMGPSGVGKTHTAKLLAREIFGNESSCIRLDMSEFMERHNVARLIGAPAGYVGYGEGGGLTETVRRKPYSVVLFDEIEKAHPDVFNILLQILEEGQLTDSAGKIANFRNCIVILTSNIGLETLNSWARSFGFDETDNKTRPNGEKISAEVLSQIRKFFRPEFLNRIDQMAVFNPLEKNHLKKIVKIHLSELADKLGGFGHRLEISASAVSHLAEASFRPEEGARSVRRQIRELVEDEIANQLLSRQSISGEHFILHTEIKSGKKKLAVSKK